MTFHGVDVHPGWATGKLVNATRLAGRFLAALPPELTPEATRDREGFVHAYEVDATTARAVIKLIARDFDDELLDQHVALVRRTAEEVAADAEVEVKRQYSNMREHLDAFPEVVERAAEAIRAEGLDIVRVPIRGGTDGSILSARGLPTPNLFTGGHEYHSRREWASVQDMASAAATIVRLAEAWARQWGPPNAPFRVERCRWAPLARRRAFLRSTTTPPISENARTRTSGASGSGGRRSSGPELPPISAKPLISTDTPSGTTMLTAPMIPMARNSAPSASSASRRSMSTPPMTATAFVRRDGRQRPLRVSPPMIATTQRRSLPGGAGGGREAARGGQVGGQHVEVSARARRVGELDALGELLERQPALAARGRAGARRSASRSASETRSSGGSLTRRTLIAAPDGSSTATSPVRDAAAALA